MALPSPSFGELLDRTTPRVAEACRPTIPRLWRTAQRKVGSSCAAPLLSSFLDTAGPTLRDRCWLHRTCPSRSSRRRWYGLFARSHTFATSVAE